MSIIEQARSELARINFGEDDSRVMIEILEKFFDQWDSGGAVHAVAPVMQRLIAGKPLSPLTGDESEWFKPMDDHPTLQNMRCSSVFKEGPDGEPYDIATDRRVPITFPYWPDKADVPSPVMEVQTKG